MKNTIITSLLFVIILNSCRNNVNENQSIEIEAGIETSIEKVDTLQPITNIDKIERARELMVNVLQWSDSVQSFHLLTFNQNDSVFNSIDTLQLERNLELLNSSRYFTQNFIDNYENIIRTISKKLNNGEYPIWYPGELPPFYFSSDLNPWCLCQDNYGWNSIKVEVINEKEGEFKWTWKELNTNNWSYTFKVINVKNQIKIDYLEGFDYANSINAD
ncbi:hypothetical protein SAMN05216474_0432 [Lishizhenia tianjinensis]|uniref:Uncharacterized protein n=1 Tax=Lishizhenia tianjinensis TaxID=477690 RepID=A0A1I6XTU4_9FLAO|nr:hypothetical protein [Lishizhenia tianjinensis]SFT41482.1 hypothetical protein SAMN05216474_0432 [Lishizhenia tianjinensis]